MEAIKPSPSAQRESSPFPELPCERRPVSAEPNPTPDKNPPHPSVFRISKTKNKPRSKNPPKAKPHDSPCHPAAAGSGRSEHWKRSNPPPARQRKSPPFPELPCERRPVPAEPNPTPDKSRPHPSVFRISKTQNKPRSKNPPKAKPCDPPCHPAAAGSGRSKHWKRSNPPPARSAKALPSPSFPASADPFPRSPTQPQTKANPSHQSSES